MASLLRSAPRIFSDSSNSSPGSADNRAGSGPSLMQSVEQTSNRQMPDIAMERAREDFAEKEYLSLIRWAVRRAPELLRALRIAYLFGQDPATRSKAADAALNHLGDPGWSTSEAQVSSEKLEDMEREHIRRVLRESPNLAVAAQRLGINNSTLWRKRKRYDLL